MDLNSIYEVTQNSKTRWACYAYGGDTYLTMSMLQSAGIIQTVNENLTNLDAFFAALLRESKVYVQELDESGYHALLKNFYNNKEVGSVIIIDFDNDMMHIRRNALCRLDDYQIKISDARALHEWFSMQTPYCRLEDTVKRLSDFEDEIMRFLDRDNEHLQNCRSKRLRFRNENGSLKLSVDKLCEFTKPEADNYYIDGDIYEYQGKRYTFFRDGREAMFLADDGTEMYCDANHLGTYLPDVASEGMAVVRVPVGELRQLEQGKMSFCDGRYTTDFKSAKRNFAQRSGLVHKSELFSPPELQAIQKAVHYTLRYRMDNEADFSGQLQGISLKLDDALPESEAQSQEKSGFEQSM